MWTLYRKAVRTHPVNLARHPVEPDEFGSHCTYIMDNRGEGVPAILSRSEQLAGKAPEYRLIDESELLLTIYAAAVP